MLDFPAFRNRACSLWEWAWWSFWLVYSLPNNNSGTNGCWNSVWAEWLLRKVPECITNRQWVGNLCIHGWILRCWPKERWFCFLVATILCLGIEHSTMFENKGGGLRIRESFCSFLTPTTLVRERQNLRVHPSKVGPRESASRRCTWVTESNKLIDTPKQPSCACHS